MNQLAMRTAAKAASYLSPAIFAGRNAFVRRISFPSSSSAASSEQMPRFVFGPAPTFEEAKDATTDLMNAVQRTSNSQATTDDLAIIPKMSGRVVEAFFFLRESPKAKDIIASLACDKNVWDALMNNEKVLAFLDSHQTVTHSNDGDSTESVNSNASGESSDDNTSYGFKSYIKYFKIKVEGVLNNISGFFQDIWGLLGDISLEKGSVKIKDGSYTEATMGIGATGFALAVVTILLVMLKRA